MVPKDGNLGPVRFLFLLQKLKPVEDEQARMPPFFLQGRKHADYSTEAVLKKCCLHT